MMKKQFEEFFSVRKNEPNNYLIRHVHLTEVQLNNIAAGFSRNLIVWTD